MTTFLWTIDDAGSGGADMIESVRRSAAMFEAVGHRATWFTVPRARGEVITDDWVEALREVLGGGHDVQLHGLTHEDCYEFGPPAWPATDVKPDFITDFSARRDELLPRYTVEKLKARIELGRGIFRDRLGVDPVAFRAPCGARSTALYEALQEVGIGYDSSVYLGASGYQHLPHQSGDISSRWQESVPPTPFRWYSGIVQLPILNEYTWRGAGERSAEFVDLASGEVARIAEVSDVAVILMHTHGIASDYDHAERLIEAVAARVSDGLGRFATVAAAIGDGTVAAAATEGGPPDLPV